MVVGDHPRRYKGGPVRITDFAETLSMGFSGVLNTMVKTVSGMAAEYGSYRTLNNPSPMQSFSEIGDPDWTTQVFDMGGLRPPW
ncbi:unnamed protein product [Nippostrongylus brasiliensis]|uniref:CAZy families GT51 protein n=1 Tax=Nippostrongylus brasiliensis TaxID=27835 RepID=A0A0N4XCE4_NIPBR|nr:unnamed protein product [Nippostrongylus brasiliensis]